MLNLENNHQLIQRLTPIFSKPSSKITSYEIKDSFLRFWFRFICPYQSLVERQLYDLLLQNIQQNYEQFTGKTLEHYFQISALESGKFTQVGRWWNRKGLNEIDLIALNDFDHTGIIAEVKHNPHKIDMHALHEKANNLPTEYFSKYTLELISLSLQDM